jgi:hypothetical protein
MRIRITQKYAIWIHETHEVDIDGQEEIDFLNEEQDNAQEFTCTETLIEKVEGDCVNGTWDVSWKEVPVLDQIVEALNADE